MVRLIYIIILFQLIACIVIFAKIYHKEALKKNISISTLSAKDINMGSLDLKHFYEPKPNRFIADDRIGINGGYTINSDALNERFNYSVQKEGGVFRIITLGDSITYGFHVATKDNWTEVLEDNLNQKYTCSDIKKYEVINLAVWGYDNDYAVERYRVRGEKYNPDLVIWYQFDMERWNEAIQSILDRKGIKNMSVLSPALEKAKFKAWKDAQEEVVSKFGDDKLLEIEAKAVLNLRKYYQGKVVLVAFPEWEQKYKDYFKRLVKNENNYYLLDNTRDYLNLGKIVDVVHPNPEGHKIIAEDILNYLNKIRLLPCK